MKTKFRTGFTLIELLVVIAIISLLSSVVLASLNSARAKARDARKIADFKNISTALQMFYDSNGRMPNNPTPGTEVCDDNLPNYSIAMGELISGGFLSSIPRSPGGYRYCYYNYSAGSSPGALMVTVLETVPDTTTGISPSCRPWEIGQNWCDKSSSKYYCICNTY
ncbi:MAG: type II secretion system protein [bacterium]|nr:type II secretion system protein [bacterium]